MKKRTTLASIDVGTTKICTTVAEVDGGMLSESPASALPHQTDYIRV